MAQYGVKVAQQGVPVDRAGDYQLVLSTDWPTLRVHKQGKFTVAPGNQITTHELKYSPTFLIMDQNSLFAELPPGVSRSASTDTAFLSSPTDLRYSTNAASNFSGYYYLFDYEFKQSFRAPSESASNATATKSPTGVKITKPGSKIDSTDGRDFSLNTDFRPLTVHMSGEIDNVTSGVASITITHNLGYFPAFLLFQQNTTDSSLWQNAVSRTTATAASLTFRGVQAPLSGNFRYIVFKDPLFGGA